MHEIKRIARLAKLHLEASEEAELQQQLARVFEYLERLEPVSLEGGAGGESAQSGLEPQDRSFREPAAPPLEPEPLKPEAAPLEPADEPGEITPALSRSSLLANAPRHRDGHLVVPGVFSAAGESRRGR
ncbi:MAG: aspartyl/glutamyl-tRNA amidotransferase subunit C [Acidobacteriota bacterium]